MTTFVLVIHTLIAAALVAVVLVQRSEGGGLGIGGGPTGLMTARGAANLLTRATTVLATLFIGTSILLAVLYSLDTRVRVIDPDLAAPTAPAAPPTPAPMEVPFGDMAPAAPQAGTANPPADEPAQPADQVPLAE